MSCARAGVLPFGLHRIGLSQAAQGIFGRWRNLQYPAVPSRGRIPFRQEGRELQTAFSRHPMVPVIKVYVMDVQLEELP